MPDTDPNTTPRDWRALLIDRLAGLAVAGLAVVLYALGAPDEVWILVLLGGLALVGVSVPLRGQRGFARVAALVPIVAAGAGALLLLVLALLLAPGCASREVTLGPDAPAPVFEMRRGPPCLIVVYEAPGKKTASVKHDTKRCEFILDGEVRP